MKIRTKTVLGSVIGSKNLDGSWAPRSTPPDGPAVTVADLADGTTVAVSATLPEAPAGARETSPATTPDTPKPSTSAGPSAPAKAGGGEAEQKAKRLLSLAKSYLGSNFKGTALKKLEECVEKYPKTDAAKEARKMLADF